MLFLSRTVLPAMIAVVLIGAPVAAGDDDIASVTVKLSSFKYDPKVITLDHGAHYLIHFVNTSTGGHDFVAKEFFAKAQVAEEDRPKVAGGRVELDGRENVDIHLTAPAQGTYKVHCSHFMHTAFGMTGEVVVR